MDTYGGLFPGLDAAIADGLDDMLAKAPDPALAAQMRPDAALPTRFPGQRDESTSLSWLEMRVRSPSPAPILERSRSVTGGIASVVR